METEFQKDNNQNMDFQQDNSSSDAIMTDRIKTAKKVYNSLGLRLLLGSVLFVALQIIFVLIAVLIWPEIRENKNIYIIVNTLPNYVISLPVLFFLLFFMKEKTEIQAKSMKWYQFLIIFTIAYAGLYLSNLIGTGITYVASYIKKAPVNNELSELISGVNPFIVFVLTVILAPIYEEFIFRKMIITRTIKYGELPAILISGFAFGLYHGNISQTIYATVIGLVFGYVFVRTGKIIYTIILHMCINFMGSIVSMFILKLVPIKELSSLATSKDMNAMSSLISENLGGVLIYYAYVFVVLGIVCIGVVSFCINLKKIFFIPTEEQLPKEKIVSTILLNVGIILLIIFWTGMIIYQLVI